MRGDKTVLTGNNLKSLTIKHHLSQHHWFQRRGLCKTEVVFLTSIFLKTKQRNKKTLTRTIL